MNDNQLKDLLEAAKKEKASISSTKVQQRFLDALLTEKQRPKLQRNIAMSILAVAATLTGLFLFNPAIFNSSIEGNEQPKSVSAKYSLERVASKRKAFIQQVNESGSIGDGKIQILKRSNQPLMSSEPIPTLKVDLSILEKLGIKLSDEELTFEANIIGHGYLKYTLTDDAHSLYVDDDHKSNIELETKIYPLFVSKMNGYQRTRYAFVSEGGLKKKQKAYNTELDELVPIAIPKPSNTNEYIAIFWFESTEALFDILSQEIPGNAASNSFLPDEETSETITVLQNPVKNQLKLNYQLPDQTRASISLISVDGNHIKTLIDQKSIRSGSHELSVDVSTLRKGIYLIQMATSEKRITKRIIKE